MPEYTTSSAEGLFKAGIQGDFSDFPSLSSTPEEQEAAEALREADAEFAWELALGALRYLAEPDNGRLPSLQLLERFVNGSAAARYPAALAAGLSARAALLAFDARRLGHCSHILSKLADAEEVSGLWQKASEVWHDVVRGAAEDATSGAEELFKLAQKHNDARAVIEATVLRSMASLLQGDLELATKHARRASRMARTESLPQEEYLANVVLARVRRLNGAPHLATRILYALLRAASPPWRQWLLWELVLANGANDRVALEDSGAAGALAQMLEAADSGDRHSFETGRELASQQVEGCHTLMADLSIAAELVDPDAPARAGLCAPWCSGRVTAVPEGLHGVASRHGRRPADPVDAAWVIAFPGLSARRILGPGRGLALLDASVHEIPVGTRRKARTDAAIAALLLAGPAGAPEELLFRELYGFEFNARLHTGARDVLLHRVRNRLEGLGQLEREHSRLIVKLERPVLTPDPRCSPPPEHTVLLMLAERGRASVREAAEALSMPIRTVQHALRQLAEEGACRSEKHGRALEYHLEDTTFMEPTAAHKPRKPQS